MKKLTLIIPAAGESQRMKAGLPKPLLSLDGKTILERSIEPFLELNELERVVVLCPTTRKSEFDVLPGLRDSRVSIIEGGISRQQSVFLGLKFLSERCSDLKHSLVAIHDAARCLLRLEDLQNVLKAANKFGAAALAVPVVDSLKLVKDGKIERSVDRSNLFSVQTPQVFDFDLILKWHEIYADKNKWDFTDDTAMLEGEHDVYLVTGDRSNIKITTKDDLLIAQSILKSKA